MRLLHIADVHLERSFRWLGPERGNRRRQELRDALRRAIALAADQQVDALCIAGDLYEFDNAGPATGDFLASAFKAIAPIPVLIAPGNHDYFRPGCLYDRVRWSSNVRVFRSPTLQSVQVADGVVWGRAFTGSEDLGSPLAGFGATGSGPHMGLIHGDVVAAGSTSIYGPIDPAEIAASSFRFLMLGHVHAGRVDEAHRFAYAGSIEPLDTSESGDRWALLHEVSGNGTFVQRLTIARRRIVVDELDLTGIATIADLRRVVDGRSAIWEGNDVRLRLTGGIQGELALRPDAIEEMLAPFDIELTMSARVPVDFDALGSQHSTLGSYVRHACRMIAEATDEDERRRWVDILDVGVAAFTKGEVVLR